MLAAIGTAAAVVAASMPERRYRKKQPQDCERGKKQSLRVMHESTSMKDVKYTYSILTTRVPAHK